MSIAIIALMSYMTLASGIFEKDKKAYIFDSSFSLVNQIRERIDLQIKNLSDQAKVVVYSYDFENKKAPPAVEALFSDKKSWRILTFWKVSNLTVEQPVVDNIIWMEKENLKSWESWFKTQTMDFAKSSSRFQLVTTNISGNILALFKEPGATDQEISVIGMLIEDQEIFPMNASGMDLALSVVGGDGKILKGNRSGNDEKLVQAFTKEFPSSQHAEISTTFKDGVKPYLISTSRSKWGDFFVMSFIPQSVAFSSLETLYEQSLFVLLLLVSLVVLVTFFFSGFLTSNLKKLALATRKVSEGDVAHRIQINSWDEFGTLGNDFNQMSEKIQNLLHETADLARMEAELKTAQAVQETLFAPSSFKNEYVSIGGVYVPASECGGDWWFYFEKNEVIYLIVADATGHGVPAALITSAARAAVSMAEERKDLSLGVLASCLNKVIYEGSKGKLMMTAFMISYDCKNGVLKGLNASHEPPAVYRDNELIFVEMPNNPRIGQMLAHDYRVGDFNLSPEEILVLFTDGVTAIENSKGKEIGERRFMKILKQVLNEKIETQEAVNTAQAHLEEYRENSPLKDDVTMVFFSLQSKAS